MVVREKELKFLNEAIRAFMLDEALTTYRNDNDTYIALRVSHDFSRDSILVLETRKVAKFANVLPEGGSLVLRSD